jgi:WD40 repeat protein/tRNA A-37 threonylcarbamoyl transferase component Bud32
LSERDERLQSILVAYIEAAEAGRAPSREELLTRHPEFAAELAEFLDGRERIDRAAGPLHAAGPSPTENATVGPAAGQAVAPLGKVRYFGDYELLEEIARGGMGIVFKARQVSLNRIVALKMILAGQLASDADVRRFHAEAEAAANLDHQHIVPIYEVGEHEGQHYFSMKLIEGSSLAHRLAESQRSNVPLTIAAQKEWARLLAVVARAVHYAHQRGILHRDLKPANILIDRDGLPHVSDFGLAKQLHGAAGQTQSGAIVGTPSYMAPEQARAEKSLSVASDVYSLGAVLYECLTGRPPFHADTPLDTLLQVIEQEAPRPSSLRGGIDRDLETICLKCLNKASGRRYASAEALAEDLERWLAGEPIQARPASGGERLLKWAKRRPTAAALAAVSVLALALLIGGLVVIQLLTRQAYHDLQGEQARTSEALGKAREEEKNARDALQREQRAAYVQRLALAFNEWSAGNAARSVQLLGDCPTNLRRWEWHYLQRLCHAEKHVMPGHSHIVVDAAFSPDSQRLATCSLDGSIRVWDTRTGNTTLVFRGHTLEPQTAAFHPDGKRIVSGSTTAVLLIAGKPTGEVLVWDAATGKVLLSFGQEHRGVLSVACTADGKRIVSTGLDQTVRLWDADTGKALPPLALPKAAFDLAIRANGQHFAVSLDGMGVRVYAFEGFRELFTLAGEHGGVFSADGQWLATLGEDETIHVWDADTGKAAFTLRPHRGQISSLHFSPDGKRLASGGEDGLVKVFDVATRQELYTLHGHGGWVRSAVFSPDGRLLATTTGDLNPDLAMRATWGTMPLSPPYTVRLWDATRGQEYRTIHPTAGVAALSPTAPHIAVGDDKQLAIHDTATGAVLHTFPLSKAIKRLAYSPDGKGLAVALSDDSIREHRVFLLDAASGKVLLDCGKSQWQATDLQFSADGKLAIAFWDKSFQIWDVAAGKLRHDLKDHDGFAAYLAFHPNGSLLLRAIPGERHSNVITGETTIKPCRVEVWDPETGAKLRTITDFAPTGAALCFHPDGKSFAVATGNQVDLFTVDGTRLATLTGFAGDPSALAFDRTGERLAVVDSGGVKLWDPESRQEVLTLRGKFSSVAFSKDGNTLVTVGRNTRIPGVPEGIRLWSGEPIALPPIPTPPAPKEEKPRHPIPPPDTRPEPIRAAVGKSVERMNQGDLGGALLWAVDALQADADPQRQQAHRLRIALLLQEMPRLRPVVPPGSDRPVQFVADKVSDPPATADRSGALWERYNRALLSADGKRIALFSHAYSQVEEQGDAKQGRPSSRIEVFDALTGKLVGPTIDTRGPVKEYVAAFSPDGKLVAAWPGWQGDISIWDVESGKRIGKPFHPEWQPGGDPQDGAKTLLFSPDSRWVIVREELHLRGPHVAAWEAATGKPLELLAAFNQLFFSDDGRRVVTAWNPEVERRINLSARVWDLETRQPLGPPLPFDSWLEAAALSSDGKRLALSTIATASVWDVATGKRLFPDWSVPYGVRQFAFSPDGKRLAVHVGGKRVTVKVGTEVQVWDAITGAQLAGWNAWPDHLQFLPDGHGVLTVLDGKTRLWDPATGEPLGPVIECDGWPFNVPLVIPGTSTLVSPDGRTLRTRRSYRTSQFDLRRLDLEEAPIADLQRLAQALSGGRLDGGILKELPADEVQALRRGLWKRFPHVYGPAIERVEAVLVRRPDPRWAKLLAILEDPKSVTATRARAIERLVEFQAVPALLRTFKESKDTKQRQSALLALGHIGAAAKSTLPELEIALKKVQEAKDETSPDRWLLDFLPPVIEKIRKP